MAYFAEGEKNRCELQPRQNHTTSQKHEYTLSKPDPLSLFAGFHQKAVLGAATLQA